MIPFSPSNSILTSGAITDFPFGFQCQVEEACLSRIKAPSATLGEFDDGQLPWLLKRTSL